jgi:methyl-accepting chemotaxis protein
MLSLLAIYRQKGFVIMKKKKRGSREVNSGISERKKDRSGKRDTAKTSIRVKIAASIGFAVILVSALIASAAAYAISQSTYNALAISMEDSAGIAANVINKEIEARVTEMKNISAEVNVIISTSLKRFKIDSLTEEYGYEFMGMADETGLLAGDGETMNVAEEEFFIDCRDTLEPYVSDVIVDESGSKASIIVAVPHLEDGVFKGVMYGIVRAEYISGLMHSLKMGENGTAYIINSAGDVMAHEELSNVYSKTNPIRIAETDPSWEGIAEVCRKAISSDSSASYYVYNGISKLAVASDISGTNGWSIILTADRDEFTHTLLISIFVLAGASLVLVVLAIIASMFLSNSIAKPIKTLESSARQMAEGDLNVSIASTGRDEVAQLAESMRSMQQNLRIYVSEIRRCLSELADGNLTISVNDIFRGDFNEIRDSLDTIISALRKSFSDVKESADRIAASSEQVAGGSQALATGAAEQASTIEQMSAMVQEIAIQAEQTVKHTEEADNKIRSVASDVGECNFEMQQLSGAMDEIEKASNEISKIIKAIEDIAFQTNILALNAAVEAARAGNAGKGFAVVADEVRNLASKSAEAAKDTTLLIQSTVNAVKNGTEVTAKTADSLARVVENVRAMEALIRNIATAAEQQAMSVDQVNMGFEQISSVIQTNSATAEESAAASQEMMFLAQMLKNITESLRLNE